MAAKASKEVLTKGVGKVSTAIANAYGKHAVTGDLLNSVCLICTDVFGGAPANSLDQKKIATDVARIRGWTKASEGPRKSEVRKMVRNYPRFIEAAEKYRETHDNFPWGVAMRLLTCLNREPSLGKALGLMDVGASSREAQKPGKVMAAAISKIMNIDSKASKIVDIQAGLAALCIKCDVDW